MDKPKLEELKVGMPIWLDRVWVGKCEHWGRKFIEKGKWTKGTITSIKENLITISESDWDYIYEINYQKDEYGKDWFIIGRRNNECIL